MVHILHMDQHLAQGISLFYFCCRNRLGALREYWKAGNVDLRAGILCAVGMTWERTWRKDCGADVDALLKGLFGGFLMFSAVLLW